MLLPVNLDFFDDNANFRTIFREIFTRLNNLGKYTTNKLHELNTNGNTNTARFSTIYKSWLNMFVQETASIQNIKTYTLPKELFGTNEKGTNFKIRNTIGMHIFFELSRLKCLIDYPKLLQEQQEIIEVYDGMPDDDTCRSMLSLCSLRVMRHEMWSSITQFLEETIDKLIEEDNERRKKIAGNENKMDYVSQSNKKYNKRVTENPEEDVDLQEILYMKELLTQMEAIYKKPVFEYTQKEIIMAINYLIYQLNNIPIKEEECALEETRLYFNAVWSRNSLFFCEAMTGEHLNEESMREKIQEEEPTYFRPNDLYHAFCSVYFGIIIRRFYYHDILSLNELHLQEEEEHITQASKKCKEWFLNSVIKKMPEEAIMDLYWDTCDAVYSLPGDETFFTYKYPRKVRSTGAFLQWMRPAVSKQFHGERNLSFASIIASADKTYISRVFVINVLDKFLKIQHPNCHWKDAVIVQNSGIELSKHRLMSNKCPLLVQTFSSFCPYDRGCIYKCDSIYVTIVIWFKLLHERYDDCLNRTNLSRYHKLLFDAL